MRTWKYALAVLWPLCAWAAAPPYLHPDESGGALTPLYNLEEPFKAAVVGRSMLVHQREGSRVSAQAVLLGGPARLRRFFVPPPPYPGPDEDAEAARRRRAGLTITAHVNEFPLRWHVTKDAYYVAQASGGLGRLNRASTERLNRFCLDDILSGKARSFRVAAPGPERVPAFTRRHSPATSARGSNSGQSFEVEAYYDYLPDGPVAARQFLVAYARDPNPPSKRPPDYPLGAKPCWSFRAYRCESRWDAKAERWNPGPWTRECELPVAFKEHFQAFQKGENWFFLTASGKLFVSEPGTEPGKRGVALVHGDAKRPILGTIVDALEERTFVFLDTAMGPAFFELSDKPKPVVYDPKAAKVPEGDEPLKGIMHKARILAALGRIKGK